MFGRKDNKEKVPRGVVGDGGRAAPVESLRVNDLADFDHNGRHHQNTFKVKRSHKKLINGKVGVQFNVETVPNAIYCDQKKPLVSREDVAKKITEQATKFHGGRTINAIEVASEVPQNLVYTGGQGFLAACLTAFAQHLPLELKPDHIWALITYAFAKHVDANAEALRKHFVKHEGKKRLLVMANNFTMSKGEVGVGSPPHMWEQDIFPSFSEQIKEYIGDKIHEQISGSYSSTVAAEQAACEIALMSSMKNYFSFGMQTMCGIPNVTLLGTEDDWVALRARAEALGEHMMPDFSKTWMSVLLPVLDEFVKSYKGNVNHSFWQTMVKLRATFGSGASSYISGWMQILFPYLASGQINRDLRPWQEMYFLGPTPEDFPSIISSTPVDWDYYGVTHNLHFHAGFSGCSQNPTNGTLTPNIGWYITHDPDSDETRIKTIEKEIIDLVRGHSSEVESGILNTQAAWCTRVQNLHDEKVKLERIIAEEEIEELRKASLEKRKDPGYDTKNDPNSKRMKTLINSRYRRKPPVEDVIRSYCVT